MKTCFALLTLFCLSASNYAAALSPFKDADGNTKWQYVANFSSSVLIVTLIILAVFLLRALGRASRSNRELTDIKTNLEDRVARRTASLEQTTQQLAQREAYIKSAVDSMPLMLIGINKEMAITQWNHVAETVTGRRFESINGMNLWEVYPTLSLTKSQIEKVFSSRETTTIKHSQRGQYYFDITLYALPDPTSAKSCSNSETGVVILVDDITKQMKAENKLVERNKMSAMGELASAMAHDINIPLHGITDAIEKVKSQINKSDAPPKSSILAILDKAQQSGKQAGAIIDNLLQFADNHRNNKQTLAIAQIMDNSIEVARTLYAVPNSLRFEQITLNKSYSDDVPEIPCFATEMQQVFLRILRHCFYALIERTKHRVFVPVINVEVSNFYDSVWVKIQHNGQGLSPEEQQDVFEPFFSNTSNQPACPVEQRLSYSHFIVTDNHKGQIAVTSALDVGTTFHIQLPLA
ncbi:MAG: ATP-binding protein [Marinagarivorans sp.]|nr:ATP-binding protein [Marinagarivorans sp.]